MQAGRHEGSILACPNAKDEHHQTYVPMKSPPSGRRRPEENSAVGSIALAPMMMEEEICSPSKASSSSLGKFSAKPIPSAPFDSKDAGIGLRHEGAPIDDLDDERQRRDSACSDSTAATTTSAASPSGGSPTGVGPLRRSGREKTSTLVYIDGIPVLKTNNYKLKGFKYQYGAVGDDEEAQSRPPSPKKVKKLKEAEDEEGIKPSPKKARRAVSSAEMSRREHNERVECRKAAAQEKRRRFLRRHATVLEPFAIPSALREILSDPSPGDDEDDAAIDVAPVPQPRCIEGQMRNYQIDGLNFMVRMHRQNLGMILADEMGLGKTLQTISLVCYLKEAEGVSGPSLVVCPLTVLSSWCSELEKWAPSLRFLRLHDSVESVRAEQRRRFESNCQAYDVVVTTYDTILADNMKHLLQRQHFNYVVLDEGHKIKRHDTLVSQAARQIHCENKLILTGTPLQNNLYELWSLLDFLCPSLFDMRVFVDAFNLNENRIEQAMMDKAQNLLDLFMLRRLKTHVEAKLPPKLETRVYCPMSTVQTFWYKALLLKDLDCLARTSDDVPEEERSTVSRNVLTSLMMQLRKCCQHPFLFDGAEPDAESTDVTDLTGSSGKLAVLDMLLQSLFKKNHRVVIFSQFTRVLDILDDYCSMRSWPFARFDGSTGRALRTHLVQQFNAENSPYFVFLMSTKSGGMGINLQTADTCILFDSDWNPQSDIQAQARVHRIGQTKPVHVYRLVTAGSVEERMLQRAERKLLLDGAVTRENSNTTAELVAAGMSAKEMLADIKFGCQAIFGDGAKNELPTMEDIELITDRNRTGNESMGKLKGDQSKSAATFDAHQTLQDTQLFGGVDFRAIRRQQSKKERQQIPKTMADIPRLWNDLKGLRDKRQVKSRVVMVETESGRHESVLAVNNYDIEHGESSVFDRELKNKVKPAAAINPSAKTKEEFAFHHQVVCQVCHVGGQLVRCMQCPIAMHHSCIGVEESKQFHRCSHHRCNICFKPPSQAGQLLFACQSCEFAWCEDCLPKDSDGLRVLGVSDRFKELGFASSSVAYIHCSHDCESRATLSFGWTLQMTKQKKSCPEPLDVSSFFGSAPFDLSEVDGPPDDVSDLPRRTRNAAAAAAAAISSTTFTQSDDESLRSPTKSTSSSVRDPTYDFASPGGSDSSDRCIRTKRPASKATAPSRLSPSSNRSMPRAPSSKRSSSTPTEAPAAAVAAAGTALSPHTNATGPVAAEVTAPGPRSSPRLRMSRENYDETF